MLYLKIWCMISFDTRVAGIFPAKRSETECKKMKESRSSYLTLILMTSLIGACVKKSDEADLILMNGNLFTANESVAHASAVAIRDGKFVFVGNNSDVLSFAGPDTRKHDLAGATVIPGLVDSHTHPGLIARTTDSLVLPAYASKAEVLSSVAQYAAANPDADFIVGGYWQTSLFDEHGPHKSTLDEVVSDRPVVLVDTSGHSQWINSKTLEVLRIDKNTPDPVSGLSFFHREPNGEPTGWVKEFAIRPQMRELGMRGMPDPATLKGFLDYLSSMGVVTLFDGGNSGAGDTIYEMLAMMEENGQLPLRYEGTYHIILPEQIPIAIDSVKSLQARFGGDRLRINTVKIHYDGVHEIGTSGVIEPFINTDDENRGGLIMDTFELKNFMLQLDEENIDLHLHTVGDRATRSALDAAQSARDELGRPLHIQVTLCHLELIADEDFSRFRELDIIANFSPHWHGGWIDGAQHTLGQERFDLLYRAQPLINDGATVTFSSDIVSTFEWHTDRGNPYMGMQIGHTRIEPEFEDPQRVRPPLSEQLSREDLLMGYTINGARQLKLDAYTGSIEPGKSADLVVLSDNLFEVQSNEMRYVKPTAVLLEGELVHGKLE